MNKSKIFIFLVISFAFGILIQSVFALEPVVFCLVIAVAAVIFLLAQYIEIKGLSILAGCLCCLSLGALRVNQTAIENPFLNLIDQKLTLEGYIIEDPGIKQNGQQLVFLPDGYHHSIQLGTTLTQNFFYGDRVAVTGKVNEAKNINDFDYQSYLERFNIYGVENYPKILILKSAQLNKLKYWLLKIKYLFLNRLDVLYQEPQKSLLLGILIGGHGALPKQVVDNFNATGTSHIIAVSGYNITIIIGSLVFLAYLFGRRVSLILSVLVILSFVIITGASASVVRAGIMGLLLILSVFVGRQYSVAPSLFFAGLIMLAANPKILFWDAGFQLSFAATLGIVYYYPLLESLTKDWPKLFGTKTIILGTVSAIITTAPIIMLNFGILSLVAPVVNVLILPIIPATMLFGFFSALPFLGPGFALIANWLLIYVLKIIDWFAHLPHASLNITITPIIFWLTLGGVFILYFALARILKVKQD